MIYLSNITDAQVAYVPRDTELPVEGTIHFTMKSTVDLDTVVTVLVIDVDGCAPDQRRGQPAQLDHFDSVGVAEFRDNGAELRPGHPLGRAGGGRCQRQQEK